MKFGLFLAVWENQTADIDQKTFLNDMVEYVVQADRLGLESVFFTEHHFTNLAQIPSGYEVLSYLAAKTNHIRLGTGATILPWQHPLLLAEQVATLDILSGGRFDFGVGRGFRYSECRGFNIPGEELQARYDEAIEVLEKCWSETGRFSHKGRFWEFNDVVIDPKSLQGKHAPVWVAADSEVSIRRVARQGYNLMLSHFPDASAIGTRIAAFKDEIESMGQVYDPYRCHVTRAFYLTADKGEAQQAKDRHRGLHAKHRPLSVNLNADPGEQKIYTPPGGHSDQSLLIGPKAQIIDQLHELRANGVEYILLMDVSGNRPVLRRFADEIMPLFPAVSVSNRERIPAE